VEQLLTTKLYIPPTRSELVHRSGLIKRLNDGLGRKLSLISAPAGFGKTTLVTEWLDNVRLNVKNNTRVENKIAWLSIDEGDNELTRFLMYFIAALKQIEGIDATFGKGALGMLQSPQPPPIDVVLTSLINEIVAFPNKIILILDDYHHIVAQSIHDALTFTLENQPPNVHLVIATREDPPLPLPRLRARGHLTELRAADLRFTSSEAAEFLNQVMGLDLSADDITALETRTEGWIAGLQMAALSMQGRADTASFIQAFTGSHHFILDYLVEEVLQSQGEHVRSFLLQTSILDRLCGPLCDAVRFGKEKSPGSSFGTAVTGQEDGRGMLESLERGNLFVVPLDDQRQWYRYHHLFADVLHAHSMEEQPDQIPKLHRRASEWYERNGLPSDAIRHALAAEDYERAADLAELAWPVSSGSYQSIAWLGWLKGLPDELVRTRPVLSVDYAWAFLNAGKLEAAEARLLDVEQWLEPITDMSERQEDPSTKTCPERSRRMVVVDEEQFRSLPVSLATARAYHAQAVGDIPATVKYTQQLLDLLPEGDTQWRGDVTALLGLAYWASGELEAAHQTFSDGLTGMQPLDVIVGTFVLAEIKMTLGHLHEAIRTCEHALQLAMEHGDPMPIGTEDVYTGISELHLEKGDLEGAAQDLLKSKELGEQVELPDWQYRWCIAQARLKETLGDLDGALDLLDEAERLYVRTPLPDLRPIAAMKARIWVAQGRLAEALIWARERGLSIDDNLSYLREFEHITLARVMIAQYKSNPVDGALDAAMELLERLLGAAKEGKRTRTVIEILVLQTLAYESQSDTSAALVALEQALAQAEQEGYVRIFVDEGSPMAKLLNEAASRGIQPDYSHKLLVAFESKTVVDTTQQSQQLIEPLSARELEVLQLVAKGLSNRQIGERLFLALDTVKGYNRKIYGKLGVKNRAQAVNKAISLEIIPPQ
jgi:LuxR family maltose regulon positive regulatory protein